MSLASRSGVGAGHFATWLKRSDSNTRQALKHMRPGDVFDACTTASGATDNALVDVRIIRDDTGRKLARQQDQLKPSSPSLFAGVTGEVVSTARLVPEKIAVSATPSAAAPGNVIANVIDPKLTPLAPGHLLSMELERLLGHHPIVTAAIAYAREKWHIGERLPEDSHCTLALVPGNRPGSRMQLAYIQFDYQGRTDRVYYYVDGHGHEFLVGAHGQGYRVLDPLLPVSDARISSGWGWRIQPVLGGNEFHRGVDYAAPMGTPVRATMDGVVDISEWRGEYGRLIEVKHGANLATRYGHLSAFASHIRLGSRVHRGEIIGYVGSTGLSTGPHLYYEVWDHGERINPLTRRSWTVLASLDLRERERFGTYVNSIRAAP
ncbi:MAG TPA: M23 family metallopeptidase [Dyella sp.]|uniref:M23 family metallopeptidase n=1 Tax=Dyella sp. TaxID=1869338 RepID=UPI002B599E10|nr:M23 family metallopeptidase [Dyella sp.]HUB90533.1 M23 family metallopeptidase [Dyella sp.]